MGYVIDIGSVTKNKSFDDISFITTVLSILPLISCGGGGGGALIKKIWLLKVGLSGRGP